MFIARKMAILAHLFLWSAVFVAAVPTAEVDAGPELAKRGSSGVHLVKCFQPVLQGQGYDYKYAVIYCANDGNCPSPPSSNNVCVKKTTDSSSYDWRGTQQCTFSSGVTFQWYITYDTALTYAEVGTGSNGGTSFMAYKDNDNAGFLLSGNYGCVKEYYFTSL